VSRTKRRDVIFLLGMGRSGSSALARVLSLCGGALPLDMLSPNFANPTGYWEPSRAVALNDTFLEVHGSSWYDGSLTLQTGLVGAAERRDFIAEIAEFLSNGFENRGPIVLKEPRITALLPYWNEAAVELGLTVKVIHVFREPGEVAHSLAARDGLSAAHSFALWLKYNLVGERDTRGARRIFVSYDEIMRDWESVAARCIAKLELALAVGDETKRVVAKFLSPVLRHHRSAATDVPAIGASLAGWVLRVYAILKGAEAGSMRCSELDAIHAEYLSSRHAAQFRLTRPVASR
jgi:hypothetical protein